MANVSISAFSLPDSHIQTSTGFLRLYADCDWLDAAGVQYLHGAVGDKNGFYDEVPFSVSSGTLTFLSSTWISTLDSLDQPTVKIHGQLVDANGADKGMLFVNWQIPTTSPTTFATLRIYNLGSSLVRPPDSYLNREEVQALINTSIGTLAGQIPAAKDSATLVDGAVTVAEALVQASSKILVSSQDDGVSGVVRAVNKVQGVSFDLVSSDGGDNGLVSWFIYN